MCQEHPTLDKKDPRWRGNSFRFCGLMLDAVIGALGMTAVGAALVWGALAKAGITDFGGDFPVDLANLFGDLVLIGVTCAAFTVTGWRPGRALGTRTIGLF